MHDKVSQIFPASPESLHIELWPRLLFRLLFHLRDRGRRHWRCVVSRVTSMRLRLRDYGVRFADSPFCADWIAFDTHRRICLPLFEGLIVEPHNHAGKIVGREAR